MSSVCIRSRTLGSVRRSAGVAVYAASALAAGLLLSAPARGQGLVESAGASGDSVTRGFNARALDCTYDDQPTRSWATGDTHEMDFCDSGGEGLFSHAERLECAKGADIQIFNDAETGARMRAFFAQASTIRTRFASAPGPHYVAVLLGHNDACTNVLDRGGNSCGDADGDPNNYCRSTPAAYEREFRRGLDELIQIPSTRIAVLALLRISQLCNFRDKEVCGEPFDPFGAGASPAQSPAGVRAAQDGGTTAGLIDLDCGDLWEASGFLEDVFGEGGICASLTSDCSEQRRIDMYETLVGYNEVLERVSAEYAGLPAGSASATGAVKAEDVALRFIAAPFHSRGDENDLSCCDCFHPSTVGQQKLSDYSWHGLTCSDTTPCCAVSDDAGANARCDELDTTSVYPGGFWAGDVVCGNQVLDPGETCDDGNATPGDGCSATCMLENGAATPTGTPDGTPGTPTATRTPGTPGAGCAGDCGGDDAVTVDELVLGINIALDQATVDACPAMDADGSGRVMIEELVSAVNSLLLGCA